MSNELEQAQAQITHLKARVFDLQEAVTSEAQRTQDVISLVVQSLNLEVNDLEEFVEAVQAFKVEPSEG